MNKDELITSNINLVHHVIHRNFPTYGHNEDVFQEGCIGLIDAANKYDESKGSFVPYAYTCILNKIRTYFRLNQKHDGLLSLDFIVSSDDQDDGTIYGELIPDENSNLDFLKVEKEMFKETLSERERTVLQLKEKGMKFIEIAEILGITQQGVSAVMARVKAKWRYYCERN